MKKHLFILGALLVLAVPSAAPAQAPPPDEGEIAHNLKGRVVSVDAAAGTLQVALGPPRGRGPAGGPGGCRRGEGGEAPQAEGGPEGQFRPQSRQGPPQAGASRRGRRGKPRVVTVRTDAATRIRRNRAPATLADLAAGDRVKVVILTEDEATLDEALANAAYAITARPAPVRQNTGQQGGTPQPPEYQVPQS